VSTNIRPIVDALDPEGTEIRVLNGLSRLRGRDVLEIGAGNGRLTWRYAERVASVVGVEPDQGRAARAKAATPAALRDRVDFRHADVATVDLPAARFDVVLFSWSI
jgi:16S rRNA A1518/A1519 N6-dimethyltransferase RsmA/KsgA/DIM1 with predicted DNA glycosylase/AP lyase activity